MGRTDAQKTAEKKYEEKRKKSTTKVRVSNETYDQLKELQLVKKCKSFNEVIQLLLLINEVN